jgi:NAD(P)-dependent dehydrogenase (short-subunit alcohol dehydrogenase family)
MGLLENRSLVVTGAGRGLGRAFAVAAAREGASVVVNDIDADVAQSVVKEIRGEGNRAVASVGSVSEWDMAGELIACAVREFDAIDGLVNNAVAYSFGHPWDEEPEQIRRQIEVNVLGSLYCGAHAMREMKGQRRGSIVNLTSNVMMGKAGMSTYGTTKGALASATFGWALEMMPYNVRVNALAPGAMTRAAEFAGSFGRPDKQDDPPPEAIAPAIIFLLSDHSAEITGQLVQLMGRRLGLISHPRLIEPVLEAEQWTAEAIAEAYARVYRTMLQPVGRGATSYEWRPSAAQ